LEDLDLRFGPGTVAGHRAVPEPAEDLRGPGADVLERPQVEGEAHGLPVALAEQRFDVPGEAHRLIRPRQFGRAVLGHIILSRSGGSGPMSASSGASIGSAGTCFS